jgi:hypothetical protein
LVTALAFLPLGRQDKILLLRSTLQAHLTHLTRITLWSRLSPQVAAAEQQVLLAALALVEHPPPAVMRSDPLVAKFALPLHSEGFGLRLTPPLATDASFLAAAGASDVAMRPSPPPFRPCNPASPHWLPSSLGGPLHDAAPCLWSPELRALDAPLLTPVLLHAQQEYARHLADRRFADLLASALFRRLLILGPPSLLCMLTSFHLVGHHAHLLPPHPVQLGLVLICSPPPGPAGLAGTSGASAGPPLSWVTPITFLPAPASSCSGRRATTWS